MNIQDAANIQKRLYELAQSYFDGNGYFNFAPIDKLGNPTPWFTYPAINYLKDVINKDMKVFEYGSGYSTVFFNSNAGQTVSVEHDEDWFNHIKNQKPNYDMHLIKEGKQDHPFIKMFESRNLEQPRSNDIETDRTHGLLNTEFGNYALKLTEYSDEYFDIIVVDGMARLLTGFLASQLIKPTGIIILDNSDRWQYNALQQYLVDNGFGRIDFWGPGPVNAIGWCTSFFSKQYNIKSNNINRPPLSGGLGW
jgi:hypothetical protein